MNTENTNLTNTDQIVSCSGGSCNFCSFLETLSDLYNFFLLLSFAIAVLVLVITGINYILSQGKKEENEKNKRRMKGALLGFALVLLGWLAIGTTFKLLGYKNAGSWYAIKCITEVQEEKTTKSNFGEYYQNLKVYKELTDFLASGDQKAIIEGPTLSPVLTKQLQELSQSQILHILAPTRVSSSGTNQDLFLPLLTVKKDGEEVSLESMGEYVNLIQKEYAASGGSNTVLNTLLKGSSVEDNNVPIKATGEELNPSDFNSIYSQIASIIANQTPGQGKDLNNLLVEEANSQPNDEVQRIIAILTSETLKTADFLMVEKENSSNILTDAKIKCQLSAGEWTDDSCKCPSDRVLVKDTCKFKNTLQKQCEKSLGIWTAVSDEYFPTISCGYLENAADVNPEIEDAYQRANISEVDSSSYYCKCPGGTCIDADGVCNKQEEDSDGDQIVNSRDRCPNTTKENIADINKKEGSQYYGCSCQDIASKSKECPPDQCVGEYLSVYPRGDQTCSAGEPLAYSCNPAQSYNETCANQNKIANGNLNTNKKNSQSSAGNGSGDSKVKDDFFGNQGGKDKGIGENKLGPGGGNAMYSKPEGVKAALKRIHDTDPLRYEMIFRYVSTIAPTSFSGGLCYGCGYVEVNYGLPLKMLDQVIVHESTHSGHFCRGMSETTAEVERIAVGNEIGSLERSKKDDKGRDINDMQEFPKQSKEITYESVPVRGYLSRFMPEDSPKGDLIAEDYHWAISYALSYGDNTKGPNHYGWPKKGYLLGLKDKEENKVKSIMNMDNFNCKSKPPSDLPEVPACKNAQNELKLGGR